MILFDKLRLINWHYFLNEVVPISKITFLTGANGTGKSTIIDAMQVVLTGDPAGKNFNKAASEKTGRSLKGYLYGETGEDAEGNVKSLRKGNFTSYIVLQFVEDNGHHFSLGIYFDCITAPTEQHQFFYINDAFPEHNFTIKVDGKDASVAMPGKQFVEYCKKTYKPEDYRFFENNLAYRNFILGRFGDLSEKFFSLFKKAVGFTPILNISQFITEYVCDIETHVNITNTQNNILSYKKLDIEAKKMKEKIAKLEDIAEAYSEYKRIKEETYLSQYVLDRARYEQAKEMLESAENELRNTRAQNSAASEEILSIKENIRELENDKNDKLIQRLKLPGFSESMRLQEKKSDYDNKIAALKTGYDVALAKIGEYVSTYHNLADQVMQAFHDSDLNFIKDSLKKDIGTYKNLTKELLDLTNSMNAKMQERIAEERDVRRLQQIISEFSRSSSSLYVKLENELYQINNKRTDVMSEVNMLNKGSKPFPRRYVELKEELLERLQENHDDAFVDSFCDLIDITDKKWTRAIEAVLYNKKFNFFVNDEYYEEANDIMKELCREKEIYSVSLVDVVQLMAHPTKVIEHSLADVISTDDEGARAYADYTLGFIKRCETFEEARRSNSGLLADCTGYRGYSTWYLNQKKGDVCFIGTNVSSEDTYAKKQAYYALDKEYSMLNRVYNSLSFTSNSNVQLMSINESENYIQSISALAEVEELKRKIDDCDEQMSEGNLEDISSIDEEIANINADLAQYQEDYDNLIKNTGSFDTIIKDLEEVKIPELKRNCENLLKNLNVYSQEFVESSGDAYYLSFASTASIDSIIMSSIKKYNQFSSRIRESEANLKSKREKYVTFYHLNYQVDDCTTNEEFDNELHKLNEVELPKYEKNIKEAYEKAINEARSDFLHKLRTSITEVSSQIEKLNDELQNIHFGRDNYRFSVVPNRDYREYYDMIMDDLVLKKEDPEDEFNAKYKVLLGELIDLITSASNESSSAEQRAEIAQRIDKFTDYRTYLVFDLFVKSDNSGFESSLAKTFRKKSGGETQTPFYISILASFAQLYRSNQKSNNNTLRLVIFDEAFSKMDAVRIKESVALLRNFGLQVILSTPSEKVSNLATEVDTTLVVHHNQAKKRSYIARHEVIEKEKNTL